MHSFMHTYAFIHAYIHIFIYACIHIFIYACIGPPIYTYTHMRTNKNADANDEIEPSPDERRNAQANLLGQNREGTIFDSKTGQPISHDRIQGPQDDMCYKEASR